jgi:hypothetical protein
MRLLMAISGILQYAALDDLYLDPMNPRLGRNNTGREVSQERVLDSMRDFTLDEIALSYVESGSFWTQEALLVTREKLDGESRLVVIEGNRRLAALIYLSRAVNGNPVSPKWGEIAREAGELSNLFSEIPSFFVDSREEIEAFLGFRHVTGIKEWGPAEKAEFIARLIDEQGMDYRQVMRKIGSKTPTVRRLYISYRILLQIEESVEDIPPEKVEGRFSVMYLSLRTQGVRTYLNIDIQADPEMAKRPVPQDHLKALTHFARWLFGTKEQEPLFTDSRLTDRFGEMLESTEAIQYLETAQRPKFEVAYEIAGGDELDIVRYLQQAAYHIEWALGRVHHYKKSPGIQDAVRMVGADARQLLSLFPSIRAKIEEEDS